MGVCTLTRFMYLAIVSVVSSGSQVKGCIFCLGGLLTEPCAVVKSSVVPLCLDWVCTITTHLVCEWAMCWECA